MKLLDIFKPGKHVAASGDPFNFSESDVLATVAAYDPALHEAPIVVGHPTHDSPAYGWVKALSFAEGVTRAEPDQVDPAFAEMVDAGRFKKISASFYHPESPSNPVPGVYYLRHVGFLGAMPPAVKGLRNPEFNDADEKIVTIDFSEESYGWSILSRLFRGMREYVISKDGQETADEMLSNWDIDQLQTIATRTETDIGTALPAFAEPSQTTPPPQGEGMKTKEELEAEDKRLKDAAAALVVREARITATEQSHRNAGNVAFCEQLVKAGKLHPKQTASVIAIMGALPVETTVEFSEADGKKAHKPMVDAFKSFLEAQPPIVDFAEAGKGNGVVLDTEDPTAIVAKAVEFVESEKKLGRDVSIVAAVQHVSGQMQAAS